METTILGQFCHPLVRGFENAETVMPLLRHIGLDSDLAGFLLEHLESVLRRQHPGLYIEVIEFEKAHNCFVNGMETASPNIIDVQTLAVPFDVNVVVVASAERYRLQLHVTLTGTFAQSKPDVTSDVLIQGQTYLGAIT